MASAAWVKLYSRIAESEDLADLHGKDPNAALLFLFSLPAAMPWGVLPGDARLFRAKVCPLLDLSLDSVKTALRLVVDSGLYQSYQDREGKQLLYVSAWGTYQDRQLERVGLPVYDFPPNWTPPKTLAKSIADAAKGKRPLTRAAIVARLQDAESVASLDSVLTESTLSPPREERSKRREGENDNDKGNSTPPSEGTPPAAGVASGKPMNLKLMGSPDPPADLVAAREKAKPEGVQFAVALWALFRQEGTPPKTVFAATGKFCKRHGERWRVFVDTITDTDLHGAEAETKLVGLVIDAEPENKRFTWDPEKQGVAPRATGQRFYTDSAGTRVYERDWDPDDAADLSRDIAAHVAAGNWDAKRGATKTPVAGWVCTDGHWYDKVLGEPVKGRKVL